MEQQAWRILIVEDDQRLAELTREYLLGQGGFEVGIETDGARAVERIVAEHQEIVASGAVKENHMMFLWQMVNLEMWLRSIEAVPETTAA